jgi:plasmid stability protein
MAQLTVSELDEAVKERLQLRASRNGRGLEAEVRAILEEAVHEDAWEQALREEGAPMLGNKEMGLGDLMYEHFKDRGLTDEEFARFNTGIAEINSRDFMGIPDFEAEAFEGSPSDK